MKLFSLYGDLELAALNFNSGVEAARQQMLNLKGEMENLQSESTKTGEILDGAIGHAIGDILSGITQAAIETAFTFASEGVGLASSVEEIQNVVDTTFGEASANQINAWARTTKEAYGIGALSAKEYASTMGSTLKGMGIQDAELYEMSTALVGLAGDMASFRNLGTEETFRKIMSGMTGEMEPLKELGIIMNATNLSAHALAMGIEGQWSKLDSATQTQVRYSYLMQQTADIQGDFAKTSDSYSNQIRLMQENIEQLKLSMGESLLPVLTELVGWFNSLFGSQEGAADGISAVKDAYTSSYVSIETTTTNALALVEALAELEAAGEDPAGSDTWNAILAQLQQTLPEIGGLIDEETGRITGGTDALRGYVEQWKQTSMELAQQKVVQDMYDAYATMQAEIAKLQTQQQIADTLRTGAEASMDAMGEQLLSTMLAGMETMGASAADIKAMQAFGAEGAENLLSRIVAGGSPSMIMGALLQGGDIWKNKSFEQYFEAGGGTDELLANMVSLYAGHEATFDKYNIDNSAAIAEQQALLAGQEQEIAILQQMLSAINQAAGITIVVNNSVDEELIVSKVERRISRDATNKSFTAVAR